MRVLRRPTVSTAPHRPSVTGRDGTGQDTLVEPSPIGRIVYSQCIYIYFHHGSSSLISQGVHEINLIKEAGSVQKLTDDVPNEIRNLLML